MNQTVVDVGAEFSRYPAGRFPNDGKFNGETFRCKYLTPPLKAGHKLLIKLDGAVDYGSSFLEEAFGGLVRVENFTPSALRKSIMFYTVNHPFVPDEIWSYIDDEGTKERS
jgi:hypothetical protein